MPGLKFPRLEDGGQSQPALIMNTDVLLYEIEPLKFPGGGTTRPALASPVPPGDAFTITKSGVPPPVPSIAARRIFRLRCHPDGIPASPRLSA